MNKFIPTIYQDSIYKMDYNIFKKRNIKCLLFDLDNTCIGYREKNPSDDMKKLFNKLNDMGFKVIIFTNARKSRVEPFRVLNVDINYLSKKPLPGSFRKILRKYNYKKEEVAIIGDQLFTDVYGGNKIGIITCLVNPLTKEDFFITKFFRSLEEKKFKSLEKKNILKRGKYYG